METEQQRAEENMHEVPEEAEATQNMNAADKEQQLCLHMYRGCGGTLVHRAWAWWRRRRCCWQPWGTTHWLAGLPGSWLHCPQQALCHQDSLLKWAGVVPGDRPVKEKQVPGSFLLELHYFMLVQHWKACTILYLVDSREVSEEAFRAAEQGFVVWTNN